MKETYKQMNARIMKETNALPLYFAFNDSQLKEVYKEVGVTEETAKDILTIGPSGSIIKKEDAELIYSTLKRHTKELDDAMQDLDFFKSAVLYEMANHEYQINWQGDYDVLQALGFDCEYENEMACLNDEQLRAYREAKTEYNKRCEGNDWF